MNSHLQKVLIFILSLATYSHAIGSAVVYEYDNHDRLIGVEIDSAEHIDYTYDSVGNRLSISSTGTVYNPPEIIDAGTYSLNNTQLDIEVVLLDETFGNLTYEFALGTTACGNDIFDWTEFGVQPDGTLQFQGLSLVWGQEYFVCVRVRNFAGDVITDTGSSEGIFILDPFADHEGDGASNIDEYNAGTDPFDPDTDDDGMTDGWELAYHLNPLTDDALLDKDGDRFCNLREFFSLTNPDDNGEIPDPITIYVDDDNDTSIEWGTLVDPFNTISEGIVFAGPGDTIAVASGNYVENLVADKSLTLTGEDRLTTIIDGTANSLPSIQVTDMTDGTIQGFDIRNGVNAGIHCEQSALTITDNLISHSVAESGILGDGIVVGDNSTVTITHNIIYTNDINGISIAANASAEIVNNTIVDNGTSGIDCLAGDTVTIKNNIIVQNGLYGIMCEGAMEPTISYNNVWSNYIADYFGCTESIEDISGDPLFVDISADDFHLKVCSPSIDSGDPISNYSEEPLPNGDRINMGAFGGTEEARRSIAKSADLDSDGDVDGTDLYQFTLQFGNMDCLGCLQDLDEDGDVDMDDLEAFTCNFGR
jgi:YD repeat-containing protein